LIVALLLRFFRARRTVRRLLGRVLLFLSLPWQDLLIEIEDHARLAVEKISLFLVVEVIWVLLVFLLCLLLLLKELGLLPLEVKQDCPDPFSDICLFYTLGQ
jgi:hypothetical protein